MTTMEGTETTETETPKTKRGKAKAAAEKANGNIPALPPEEDGTLMLPYSSKVSLDLPDTTDFDTWMGFGRILKTTDAGLHWWIGDLGNFAMNHGKEFAERAIQAFHDLGFADSTVQNDMSVCARYKKEQRREDLSYNHHREAAYIENRKKREELLALAASQNWTQSQVRDAVREAQAKKVRKETGESSPTPLAEPIANGVFTGASKEKTKATKAQSSREADSVAKAEESFPVTEETFRQEMLPLAARTLETIKNVTPYLEQPTREQIAKLNEECSIARDFLIQVMELCENYGAEALGRN